MVTIFGLHYLNNRVFLSRNYRLIVAPRKFDFLKTNIVGNGTIIRLSLGPLITNWILSSKHHLIETPSLKPNTFENYSEVERCLAVSE